MIERTFYDCETFTEYVVDICEFSINSHRGLRCHPTWHSAKSHKKRKEYAWACLSTTSYVIACIASQHVAFDGVCSDEPYEALRMWEVMPTSKRTKLAKKWWKSMASRHLCEKCGDLMHPCYPCDEAALLRR
jgi:hypothetical protein